MSAREFLAQSLDECEAARNLLEYSLHVVQNINRSWSDLQPSDLESVDAFTSRFARLVDIYCNRLLRSLDGYELYEPGTLLDVALRAEKRGLLRSADWLRQVKDVRNRIAHDYAGDKAREIFEFCRDQAPGLLEACNQTATYAKGVLDH